MPIALPDDRLGWADRAERGHLNALPQKALRDSPSFCLGQYQVRRGAQIDILLGQECGGALWCSAPRQHQTEHGAEIYGQKIWPRAYIACSLLRPSPLAYADRPA